jgi:hypothetical protein
MPPQSASSSKGKQGARSSAAGAGASKKTATAQAAKQATEGDIKKAAASQAAKQATEGDITDEDEPEDDASEPDGEGEEVDEEATVSTPKSRKTPDQLRQALNGSRAPRSEGLKSPTTAPGGKCRALLSCMCCACRICVSDVIVLCVLIGCLHFYRFEVVAEGNSGTEKTRNGEGQTVANSANEA